MLSTPREVIRCLVVYADAWQPTTTSVIPVAAARRGKELTDGLRAGLIDNLDERTELCRRMRVLNDRDKQLLYYWYVEQLHVDDVAAATGISRRQCFRRKASAIRKLVQCGEPDKAA